VMQNQRNNQQHIKKKTTATEIKNDNNGFTSRFKKQLRKAFQSLRIY
jgi:lipid A disaccharide synthetase